MKPKRAHILKIGVTGGIGSGKTAVCKIFESLGARVLYADDIAKEISNYDPNVKLRITRLLGSAAYNKDGSYDRAFVASRVFSNKNLQRKLNSIIHPEVEKELDRRFSDLEQKDETLVLIEAALVFEAGLDRKLDFVLVVDAPQAERVRRIVSRDGASEQDVRNRMNAQWPVQRKLDKADYIIRNNGSLQELEQKVKFLYALFQKL